MASAAFAIIDKQNAQAEQERVRTLQHQQEQKLKEHEWKWGPFWERAAREDTHDASEECNEDLRWGPRSVAASMAAFPQMCH